MKRVINFASCLKFEGDNDFDAEANRLEDKTIGFLEEYSSTIVYDPFFELSRRKMI